MLPLPSLLPRRVGGVGAAVAAVAAVEVGACCRGEWGGLSLRSLLSPLSRSARAAARYRRCRLSLRAWRWWGRGAVCCRGCRGGQSRGGREEGSALSRGEVRSALDFLSRRFTKHTKYSVFATSLPHCSSPCPSPDFTQSFSSFTFHTKVLKRVYLVY